MSADSALARLAALNGIFAEFTDMQRTDLQTVYESGQHLLALINNILDVVKLEAGKMEVRPSEFRIDAVIAGQCDIVIAGGAESMTCDLRASAHLLRRLSDHADVLVESFRPETMESWNLGWDDLRSTNEGLIWCSLSSFGRGPDVRDRVAHDLNFSAMAGVLELVGGRVPRLQLADVTSGLLAATAVISALLERERGGFKHHQQLRFRTWRQDLRQAYAPPGMPPGGFPPRRVPPPPPPPPWWRKR